MGIPIEAATPDYDVYQAKRLGNAANVRESVVDPACGCILQIYISTCGVEITGLSTAQLYQFTNAKGNPISLTLVPSGTVVDLSAGEVSMIFANITGVVVSTCVPPRAIYEIACDSGMYQIPDSSGQPFSIHVLNTGVGAMAIQTSNCSADFPTPQWIDVSAGHTYDISTCLFPGTTTVYLDCSAHIYDISSTDIGMTLSGLTITNTFKFHNNSGSIIDISGNQYSGANPNVHLFVSALDANTSTPGFYRGPSNVHVSVHP